MAFGVFLPYIQPTQINRTTFLTWCQRIDQGPFTTLAHGERTAWATFEHFTALAAMAVATERVQLWSHTLNLPLHPADFAAKRIATIDVLSEGRYTLVVGAGAPGRTQDWHSAEKAPLRFPHARIDTQIVQMRKIWNGEPPTEGGELIGPMPVQKGGPKIICGAQGPKGRARGARWGDGYAGFIGDENTPMGTVVELREIASQNRALWSDTGRAGTPYLSTSCFFALGANAKERLAKIGAAYIDISLPGVNGDIFWINSADAVRQVIANCKEAGFDQLVFIPTADDIAELDELSTILATY